MDGILALWKERGMTSHDCVFKLRKILKTKKIGHGGTLDPDVDGILPICIGKGTKVIEFMQDSGKVYSGEITVGYTTTTEDASGEKVEVMPINTPFTNAEIDAAMKTMEGEITQIPPMYSAVKVNGKRLYEYARAGLTVERPKRKAMIKSFRRTSEPTFDEEAKTQSWRFEVACGKGTYVRTLAVDTGKKLGVPAHMSDLTRLESGGLKVSQSLTLAQVADAVENQTILEYVLPIEYGIAAFHKVNIDDEIWQQVKNGMRLSPTAFGLEKVPSEPIALYYAGKVVALYESNSKEKNKLKPLKMLRTEV